MGVAEAADANVKSAAIVVKSVQRNRDSPNLSMSRYSPSFVVTFCTPSDRQSPLARPGVLCAYLASDILFTPRGHLPLAASSISSPGGSPVWKKFAPA